MATEGYDFVLAGPRIWLALRLGRVVGEEQLEPVDPLGGLSWYALSADAARLDALAALKERSLVERDAVSLSRRGTYLEPFALRALGVVREDGEVKAYGTGLLSSAGEMAEMHEARLRPLDLDAAANEKYDPTHFQPILFCAESFNQMYEHLRAYLINW